MKYREIFKKISMGTTFCVFVFSLIAPTYFFLGTNSFSNIVYARIPGMDLNLGFFDRASITAFFLLIAVFFASHTLSEKGIAKKLLAGASAVYSLVYLVIISLVGNNGLVIFGFPIISIPLWMVIISKFFILLPSAYFFMTAFTGHNDGIVRSTALFHALILVFMGIIKIFEVIFPVNMRFLLFDISVTLYLVSLSMVTFFMYRKYYE